MKTFRLPIFLLLIFQALHGPGQSAPSRISINEYVLRYKDIAIKKMIEHRIPASITLAQGLLESANGNSDLAKMANNHFGIKCHEDWTGETYFKDDEEKGECFRKYQTVEQSYEDHTRFLCTRDRYKCLFELRSTDYVGWANGLKKAGYATNPDYPKLLIRLIEENRLFEYDHAGELPFGEGNTFLIQKLPKEYQKLSSKEEFEVIDFGTFQRRVMKNNGVKYIIARKGDQVEKIARDLDLMTWQICRYNELKKEDKIAEGQVVYIQPKRRKAEEEFHVVKDGETMYTISELYAIKLKQLYKKNRMERGTQPVVGKKLWLRKKKPES